MQIQGHNANMPKSNPQQEREFGGYVLMLALVFTQCVIDID